MEIIRREMVDWEPLTLRLTTDKKVRRLEERVEHFLRRWLDRRQADQWCLCTGHYIDVRGADRPLAVDVAIEWMCERCLPTFFKDLAEEFPEVKRVDVGTPAPQPTEVDYSFVEVPAKVVTFEDGSNIQIAGFRIARSPVTVGQFEDFVTATGYQTTAEQRDGSETFRENFALSIFKGSQRLAAKATCVSHHDAMAYCQWAKLRLPTEAEWLAAALVDERLYDPVRDRGLLFDSQGRFIPVQHENALSLLGSEWTSTLQGNDAAVARFGPLLVRYYGWEKQKGQHRLVWPRDAYDVTVGFRVAAT